MCVQDSLNDSVGSNIFELVLVDIHLSVRKVDFGQAWVVLNDFFDVVSVVLAS